MSNPLEPTQHIDPAGLGQGPTTPGHGPDQKVWFGVAAVLLATLVAVTLILRPWEPVAASPSDPKTPKPSPTSTGTGKSPTPTKEESPEEEEPPAVPEATLAVEWSRLVVPSMPDAPERVWELRSSSIPHESELEYMRFHPFLDHNLTFYGGSLVEGSFVQLMLWDGRLQWTAHIDVPDLNRCQGGQQLEVVCNDWTDVYLIDSTGELVARHNTGGMITGVLAVDDGFVAVGRDWDPETIEGFGPLKIWLARYNWKGEIVWRIEDTIDVSDEPGLVIDGDWLTVEVAGGESLPWKSDNRQTYHLADGSRLTFPSGQFYVDGNLVLTPLDDRNTAVSDRDGNQLYTVTGTYAWGCAHGVTDALFTGEMRQEWVTSVRNRADGSVRWEVEGVTAVCTVGDKVVFAGPETLSTYDVSTGALEWTLPVEGAWGDFQFATDGERVMAASKSSVVAYDLATGGEAWSLAWPTEMDDRDKLFITPHGFVVEGANGGHNLMR